MGYQIVKQPNGFYALWSSVVDAFVAEDCTPGAIVETLVEEARSRIEEDVRKKCEMLDRGEKPYYQFTMTYEECLEIMRERGYDRER